MSKYRMARRSFFRGLGAGAAGVAGLKTLLRTMEASAAGTPPPPRFLMTHWPVGTQKYWFCPVTVGSDPNPALPALPTIAPNGTNWDFSRILKPFGDAGLKSDMIVLYNLNSGSVGSFGGGHEAGTPQSSTGARTPGTRSNGGETDDAVSGGPSWDQIFLKTVARLQTPGVGYVNAICDARVDSQETSTQCLSYDYKTQSTPAAQGGSGGSVTENIPLLPILSPLSLFTKLFMNVSGGGGGGADTARLLKARKSVLDCARGQLGRLKTIAPGSEAPKIDIHADAIRKIEEVLTMQINSGVITPPSCTPPAMPDAALVGKNSKVNGDYRNVGSGPTTATVDDSGIHEQIGKAHMGILKAAFVCDLIRVGTFQWSPGTNHVSFKGLYPGNPTTSTCTTPAATRSTTRTGRCRTRPARRRSRRRSCSSWRTFRPGTTRRWPTSSRTGRPRRTSTAATCWPTRSSRTSPRSPRATTPRAACPRSSSAAARWG